MQFLLLFSLNTLLALFSFDGWRGDIETPQAKTVLGFQPIISVKVFLQGPYDATTHLMKDNLRTHGISTAAGYDVTGAATYIPLANPYSPSAGGVPAVPGFTHAGNETTTSGVFTTQGTNAIIDWVLIELYSSTPPTTPPTTPVPESFIASRAALLQADGDVVDVDGTSPVTFSSTTQTGSYFIIIRHRNHLGARTSAVVILNNTTPTLVDFTSTSSTTPTFGTNATKTVETGILALHSGNVVHENTGSPAVRQLQYSGLGNDRFAINQALSGVVSSKIYGYYSSDVNMNGEVSYSGLNNDRFIIITNLSGIIGATLIEQL